MSSNLFSIDKETPDLSGAPADGSVSQLRAKGQELLDTVDMIEKAEAVLDVLKARKTELETKILPDLMDTYQVDNIGLPEAGVDIVVDHYCQASIGKDWEPEKREAAFAHLEALGGGALVQAAVVANFPKEDLGLARSFRAACLAWLAQHTNNPPPVALEMTVHHSTLSAWLRREISAHEEQAMDDAEDVKINFETLGARVGRICKIKARKAGGKKRK